MSSQSLNPVFASGNLAVITGGASGIGLALATKCASYSMNVMIVDNNASNLMEAKKAIKGNVETVEMDVARIEDFENLKACSKITESHNGNISLLALNAGIGLKSDWTDTAYFHKIMDVNLFGVIHGLNTLLPLTTAKASSTSPSSIIITGSKQGITNPPGNPAYNASKAAVKALAEHLSYDLANSSPDTSVHLLVPGWTFTGLSGKQPFAKEGEKKGKPEGAWSSEQVVEFLEKKMQEGKFYVLCPDNDVSEEMDRKRMLWTANDAVMGRPPLTRWREEYKEEAKAWMSNVKI
ncbi:related to 20beta-hydroxysteroid dehydrogenase [Rhynchosporium agropyri]|uniref:Related to 20beta-hydroxysteroid dehydrogenase n=1 Tax=Rhynchosporium agropyri TaxID=914238 RepID=A0A1E1KHE3_9HELO|nr:related to 20beta-hydroxysteroid dehydrogenase [Rhynchosporium agropyri]